jgi:hypothetical protein
VPRLTIALCLLLGLLLTACGSSPAEDVRSAVSNMGSVIKTYNESHPSSLAATALACHKAYDDLEKSSAITTSKLSGKQKAEQAVLRSAYTKSRDAFRTCAAGADANNFPAVMNAERQIAAANAAISRARALEH